jgi:hypothetical protein
MTDRAILAHHVLVLEDNPRSRTTVPSDIGPADEIDDLIGFDRAGARIHRIGADPGEIVDLERPDRAVALDADPPLAAMVTRVDIRIEAFDPVGDELMSRRSNFDSA